MERRSLARFRSIVWKYYRAHGRGHLPWRQTRDPYRILVSEVMLQQTQVERVIPYYRAWMERFPTAASLARAPLADVLRLWQGLGYNRRAKMLHAAAKRIVKEAVFTGQKHTRSDLVERLEALPGVGAYTARAVAAFAYNQGVLFIETNIRTVLTHHFFPRKKMVADTELMPLIAAALPKAKGKGGAREWYAALMDYGSYLKRSGVRINAKAKGYKKQSAFRGSAREARGAILKALAKGPRGAAFLTGIMGDNRVVQAKSQLAALTKEGMIELHRGTFRLPHG